MKNLKVVALILIAFLTFSCVEMVKEAAKNIQTDSSGSLSESNFKTVTIDNLYQLDVPTYIKEMPSLHPEASLKYANIFKEAYTITLDENKEDFVTLVKELEEYDGKKSIIDNYASVQKRMFEERVEVSNFQHYGISSINGLEARQVKLNGKVDGIDIFYVITFIEGRENIYMIMNWTIADNANKLENTFEYISGTFNLI